MKHLSDISLLLFIVRNLVSTPTFFKNQGHRNVCRLLNSFHPPFIVGLNMTMPEAISSASVFQMSLSECVSTLGPAAVPARWRTATWRLFAVRLSKRCDPTALNSSTWLLDTPKPTRVRESNGDPEERRGVDLLETTIHTWINFLHFLS